MILYQRFIPQKTRYKISCALDNLANQKKLIRYRMLAWVEKDSDRKRQLEMHADAIVPIRILAWKYPETTFMIIRRVSRVEGHCSMLNTILGHVYECEKKGYVPVIDMKHYVSYLWQAPCRYKKDNAWEYFYKQPSGVGIEQIKRAKNVVYSDAWNSVYNPWIEDAVINSEKIAVFHEMYKKYIHYNQETQRYLENVMEQFNIKSRRIVAISIRRGIEWGHSIKHPWYDYYKKTLTLDEYISLIKEKMLEWSCDYVFVSIDDVEAIDVLKNTFSDRLLYLERRREHFFRNGKPVSRDELDQAYNPDDPVFYYNREVSYLAEINIMANCTCLIASPTSGNTTAMIINGNKYEQKYLL